MRQDQLTQAQIDREADLVKAQIERQNMIATSQVSTARHGQNMVLFLLFGCFAAGVVFFAIGNPIAGGVFMGMAFIQLVLSVFPRSSGRPTRDDSDGRQTAAAPTNADR